MTLNEPFLYLGIVHMCRLNHLQKKSTLRLPGRTKGWDLPFAKLKAPGTTEGLRVDPERPFLPRLQRRGLAPSNGSIRKISGACGEPVRQRTPRVEPRYSRPNGWMMTFLILLDAMLPARKADMPRERAMDKSFATSLSRT